MLIPDFFRENRTQLYEIQADLNRSYQVQQIEDLLGSGLSSLANLIGPRSALIVTTPTVAKLYAARLERELQSHGVRVSTTVVACREESKTMRRVEHLCASANAVGLDRKSILIGFGGGVCTDLVAMAASLIRRGIAYIRIPTTLLGQVDASIGIKAAVNTAYKKSALGCFYPPESVFVDKRFLCTLPGRHLSEGLAEIIKIALVCDPELFTLLERHVSQLLGSHFAEPVQASTEIINRSIFQMLRELSGNLHEDRSYKRLVDFGHTFSQSLEATSRFKLSHGEAVAIDISLSCVLAFQLGWLDEASLNRVLSLIVQSGLPMRSSLMAPELCANAIREATAHRAGSLNLVMPRGIGRGDFVEHAEDIPIPLIESAIQWLRTIAEKRPAHQRRRWASAETRLRVSGPPKARAASA